jgi:nucleoside-diphosphate-sugar epimerase
LTGGTGFIGRVVARRLAALGWRLRLLARAPPTHSQLADVPFETVIGDLADPNSLERLVDSAGLVVHCAGLVRAPASDAFHRVNVAGSVRLGQAISRVVPSARLVVISSLAAREPRLSPYAESKRNGEDAILSVATAARWIVLRPTAVYGPWDRELLRIFRTIAHGMAPMLNGPAARLSLIHVDDLADAVAILARNGPTGAVYELDDGKDDGYSWRDVLESAAAAVGTKPVFFRVPVPAFRAAALAADIANRVRGTPGTLSAAKVREVLHPDWACDSGRRPPRELWRSHIDIAEGFKATATWYRSMGWL